MFEEELSMEQFGGDFSFNHEDFKEFTEDNDDEDNNLGDPSLEENNNPVAEDANPEEVGNEDQGEGNDNASEDEGDTSSNFFSTLTGFIHEKGLLPSLDLGVSEIKTEDEFVSALQSEIEIQSRLRVDEYLKNIDVQAIARSNQELQQLTNVTEESLRGNIEQAKTIIYNDYLNQGLPEARATRLLERLIDLGDDAIIDEALTSTESLIKFEELRIERERTAYDERLKQDETEYNQRQELIKKTVFEKKDLFKNYNAPQAVKKEVYETMNSIVSKNPETGEFENKFMKDRRENPIDFDTRMYYVYTLTKGFTDFSNLTQKGKSNATLELERAFRNKESLNTGAPVWATDSNSYDAGIGDSLNI